LYFKVSTVDARRNHEQNFAAGEDKRRICEVLNELPPR